MKLSRQSFLVVLRRKARLGCIVPTEGASRGLRGKRVGTRSLPDSRGFVCFWGDGETEKSPRNGVMRGCQTNAASKEIKGGVGSLCKEGTEYTASIGQCLSHVCRSKSSPVQTQIKCFCGHGEAFFPCDWPLGTWGFVAQAVAALLPGARMWF